MGLRELKKAKTRKMISDIATLMFMERGYHEVTTAEIALKAEVSVPTLFKYFPTKETLVFDEDHEREAALVNAVVERNKGTSILEALREHFIKISSEHVKHSKDIAKFRKLVDSTPELSHYAQQMWGRYERSLSKAIQQHRGRKIEEIEADTVSHFILDTFYRSIRTEDPIVTFDTMMRILQTGWKES